MSLVPAHICYKCFIVNDEFRRLTCGLEKINYYVELRPIFCNGSHILDNELKPLSPSARYTELCKSNRMQKRHLKQL